MPRLTPLLALLPLAAALAFACSDETLSVADAGSAGAPPVDGSGASGGKSGSGGGNDASVDAVAGQAGALPDASSEADVLVDAASDVVDAADAVAGIAPDFGLIDENPSSARYQDVVSPRDYLGQVSAWYFGHAT